MLGNVRNVMLWGCCKALDTDIGGDAMRAWTLMVSWMLKSQGCSKAQDFDGVRDALKPGML